MPSYISILRPANGLMSVIAVYIGSVLVSGPIMPMRETIIGMIVVFLISGAGMVVNDIFDVHIDKVNRPNRPLPSGRISIRAAYIYSSLLFLIGNALAYAYLSRNAFYISALATILLIAYNSKLKRVMLLGHITVSALVAITFIFGSIIQNNTYQIVLPFAALAFLANAGREIFKTIEDALGDKQHDVNTIAVRYGVFKTKVIGSLFVIAAVVLSIVPYVTGTADYVYLGLVILADVGFVASVAAPMKHSSKFVKISMTIALIAFLLGAWSMNGVF